MKATTRATSCANPASSPINRAFGKRSWRSRTRSFGSSPRRIAHTPVSLAATRIAPSEHAPTAKRIAAPSPPARNLVGVMPRVSATVA